MVPSLRARDVDSFLWQNGVNFTKLPQENTWYRLISTIHERCTEQVNRVIFPTGCFDAVMFVNTVQFDGRCHTRDPHGEV